MSSESVASRALGPAGLPGAAARVAPAIARAAVRVGEDFAALFHTARLESAFNPAARAATSSASGLFQFIESTWLSVLARHGARHGLLPASREEALALRRDPEAASLMAAEFMRENRLRLERALGRAASATDLYLAHFLGPGGALRFLSALAEAPGRAAAELFPAAAAANRPVFFAGGRPRSLAEVHALFARRLRLDGDAPDPPAAAAAGTSVPQEGGSTTRAAWPALAARLVVSALSAATLRAVGADGGSSEDAHGDGSLALAALARLGASGPSARPDRDDTFGPPAAETRAGVAEAARAAYLLLAGLGR